jgi:hypothetical protein
MGIGAEGRKGEDYRKRGNRLYDQPLNEGVTNGGESRSAEH